MRSRTTASSSRVAARSRRPGGRGLRERPRAWPRRRAPAAGGAAGPGHAHAATNGHLRAGIVSVRVTGQDWNWRAPWEKQAPWTRTVTGLVVPGHADPRGLDRLREPPAGRGAEARVRRPHRGAGRARGPGGPARPRRRGRPRVLGRPRAAAARRAGPGRGRRHDPPLAALGPARLLPGHPAPGALRAARPLADEPPDPRGRRRAPTASASRRSWSRRAAWPASSPAGRATPTPPRRARPGAVPRRSGEGRLARLRPRGARLAGPHEPGAARDARPRAGRDRRPPHPRRAATAAPGAC